MKNKRMPILAVVFAVLTVLLTVIPAVAVDDPTVGRYVISIPEGKKLICRASPSSDSDTVDYLAGGEIVEVVQVLGNWAKTIQNGKECWFAIKYGVLRTKYECAELIADVSSASAEEIDFAKLAAAGVKGVILRFGVSMNASDVIAADMYLTRNYNAATAAGLKIGLHFASSATKTTEIRKETEWTLAQIKALGLKLNLPVFYSPLPSAKTSLSQTDNTLNASFFCKTLEDAGVEAGVFLPYDWTTKNLSFANLGDYAHWIADYGDYCNFTSTYDIWQYVQNASMDGVKGTVGLNYMFKNVTVGSPTEPTQPSTEPTPTQTTAPVTTDSAEPTTVQPSESSSETAPPSTEPVSTEPAPTAPAVTHVEGDFVTVKAPGCDAWGVEAAYCTDCGKLLHTRLLPPVGHKEGAWVVISEPTDTAPGLALKYCTTCGKLIKEHTLTGDCDIHIHSFSQWNPADTQGILSADQEKYPNAVPAEEGTTADREQNPAAIPAEESTTADAQTDVTAIDPSVVGKFPCTSFTEMVILCNDCGKTLERAYAAPAAHMPAAERAVSAADCDKDGHNAVVCAVCGAVIEDEITPAYGHDVAEWTVVTAAALHKEGLRSGVCVRCGKTVQEAIPAVEALRGDVNEDGKVNSSDARLTLQCAAKVTSFTDAQMIVGDVDGNGKINASDARTILRVAAKLETLD